MPQGLKPTIDGLRSDADSFRSSSTPSSEKISLRRKTKVLFNALKSSARTFDPRSVIKSAGLGKATSTAIYLSAIHAETSPSLVASPARSRFGGTVASPLTPMSNVAFIGHGTSDVFAPLQTSSARLHYHSPSNTTASTLSSTGASLTYKLPTLDNFTSDFGLTIDLSQPAPLEEARSVCSGYAGHHAGYAGHHAGYAGHHAGYAGLTAIPRQPSLPPAPRRARTNRAFSVGTHSSSARSEAATSMLPDRSTSASTQSFGSARKQSARLQRSTSAELLGQPQRVKRLAAARPSTANVDYPVRTSSLEQQRPKRVEPQGQTSKVRPGSSSSSNTFGRMQEVQRLSVALSNSAHHSASPEPPAFMIAGRDGEDSGTPQTDGWQTEPVRGRSPLRIATDSALAPRPICGSNKTIGQASSPSSPLAPVDPLPLAVPAQAAYLLANVRRRLPKSRPVRAGCDNLDSESEDGVILPYLLGDVRSIPFGDAGPSEPLPNSSATPATQRLPHTPLGRFNSPTAQRGRARLSTEHDDAEDESDFFSLPSSLPSSSGFQTTPASTAGEDAGTKAPITFEVAVAVASVSPLIACLAPDKSGSAFKLGEPPLRRRLARQG